VGLTVVTGSDKYEQCLDTSKQLIVLNNHDSQYMVVLFRSSQAPHFYRPTRV
jgi:hypothetical protein